MHLCKDCDSGELQCTKCIIGGHSRRPLHRIQRWNGNYFEDTSLANAGLTIDLGHNPVTCVAGHGKIQSHLITVMDINGLHNVRLCWCQCLRFSHLAEELFRRQWIPATLIRPGTAFTFRVMKHFQRLSHIARTTPWDFCNVIQRLTDNIQPDQLPDIYRSFNRVQRLWRISRAYKRAGVTMCHSIGTLPCLGLQCVSCPWPGRNIPDNWKDDPDV
ncbi:hypothetical protein M422DRAFT_186662 [Sphaerobolus stellatus SS14]|uniref:CxC2-like cysteine cluster KDZ transposase-associated domain-containing protein n=1 Tax=Sphaerobolus stellatus (strain SS14) TaxID=990650 RepID=A0A0C9TLM0_SPHS4|nr:hypothetical protein M422DRAFT_186662 [Sphaerobolus stellatus SS14]